MTQSLVSVLAAALVLCGSGCGTIFNLADPLIHPDADIENRGPKVYGGLQNDIEFLKLDRSGEAKSDENSPSLGQGKGAAILLLGIVAAGAGELTLSFVADTLTLPLTLWMQEKRAAVIAAKTATVHPDHDAVPSRDPEVSTTLPSAAVATIMRNNQVEFGPSNSSASGDSLAEEPDLSGCRGAALVAVHEDLETVALLTSLARVGREELVQQMASSLPQLEGGGTLEIDKLSRGTEFWRAYAIRPGAQ